MKTPRFEIITFRFNHNKIPIAYAVWDNKYSILADENLYINYSKALGAKEELIQQVGITY